MSVAELELRVPLSEPEGTCQVIVDERDDEVCVRVLVCHEEETKTKTRTT